MKRIITIGIALGLMLPAVAVAGSVATGSTTRTATVRGLSSPRASLATYFRSCGTFNALHVRIRVHHVSCPTSRRIVEAYLHHERAGGGFQRVKGFPRWTCSTGDGSGICAEGKIASGVSEIEFFYLEAPG